MTMRASRIVGLGHHVPARRVANAELEQELGLSQGWIERRTGIKARRWAAADEAVTDLAIEAASRALAQAKAQIGEIGLVLLATSTPDHLLPPSAPLLAHRLGLEGRRLGVILSGGNVDLAPFFEALAARWLGQEPAPPAGREASDEPASRA